MRFVTLHLKCLPTVKPAIRFEWNINLDNSLDTLTG